jgi:hypothetical protein
VQRRWACAELAHHAKPHRRHRVTQQGPYERVSESESIRNGLQHPDTAQPVLHLDDIQRVSVQDRRDASRPARLFGYRRGDRDSPCRFAECADTVEHDPAVGLGNLGRPA